MEALLSRVLLGDDAVEVADELVPPGGLGIGGALREGVVAEAARDHQDVAEGDGYDDTAPWAIADGPTVVSGKPPRTLRRGAKGEDVRGLQFILIGAGLLPPGAADGIFGPATEAAVRKLQRRLALTPDGVVGPKTHTAITQLLAFLAALPPAA